MYLEHHHVCVHSDTSPYIWNVSIWLMYMYIYIERERNTHTHTHTHTIKRPSHLSPYMSLRICSYTRDLRMIYASKHDSHRSYETISCEPEQPYVLKPSPLTGRLPSFQRASPHGVRLYLYLRVILCARLGRLIRACRRNMLPEAPV